MYDISNIVYKTTNRGTGRFLRFELPKSQLGSLFDTIDPYVGLNGQMDLIGLLPIIKKPYFRRSTRALPIYTELVTQGDVSTARFSTVDERGNLLIEQILQVLGFGRLKPQQPDNNAKG